MTDALVYIWRVLSAIIILVPLLIWGRYLFKKISAYVHKGAAQRREKSDLKVMKHTLEEQKEEFINANEFGAFVAPEEVDTPETPAAPEKWAEENSDQLDEQEKESKELSDKEKKQLNTIILEADILKNEGKLEQYEKKLIEGLLIDGESLEITRSLADLYFMVGNYKKALSLLKKVTEREPSDHKSIWQIGEIYFMTGDNQTAELLVEKAINIKNDNPKYYLTMVEIYYNTKRFSEALAYMEKIIKLRPTNPKYLLAIAELYEEVGDLNNAKKYYFNVLEYEQNNAKAKARIKELTSTI